MRNLIFIAPILLMPIIVFAAIVPCGGSGQPECTICHLFEGVNNIVKFLLSQITAPLAVILLIYGGIVWITAGGDPGKIEKGKKVLWLAFWGMVIAFAAWLIVNTILVTLATGDFRFSNFWSRFPGC